MYKSDLRKLFLEKRKQLSEAKLEIMSEQIADKFVHFSPLSAVQYLHIFLPISKNKEINTFLLIEKLWKDFPQVKIVVPKSRFDDLSFDNILLGQDTILEENAWGIPEPSEGLVILKEQINMVIVPLLCFDQQGYRVGYGKGFYDRFLEGSQATSVGLSFFGQVDRITDTHSYDIPLDYCITPTQIYNFRNKPSH